jgi:hypothetical protein
MNAKQTPLPASMTGIPSAYDHATSRWRSIETTAEPGGFRLMDRDVDLFKLWQLVMNYGGQAKVCVYNQCYALINFLLNSLKDFQRKWLGYSFASFWIP